MEIKNPYVKEILSSLIVYIPSISFSESENFYNDIDNLYKIKKDNKLKKKKFSRELDSILRQIFHPDVIENTEEKFYSNNNRSPWSVMIYCRYILSKNRKDEFENILDSIFDIPPDNEEMIRKSIEDRKRMHPVQRMGLRFDMSLGKIMHDPEQKNNERARFFSSKPFCFDMAKTRNKRNYSSSHGLSLEIVDNLNNIYEGENDDNEFLRDLGESVYQKAWITNFEWMYAGPKLRLKKYIEYFDNVCYSKLSLDRDQSISETKTVNLPIEIIKNLFDKIFEELSNTYIGSVMDIKRVVKRITTSSDTRKQLFDNMKRYFPMFDYNNNEIKYWLATTINKLQQVLNNRLSKRLSEEEKNDSFKGLLEESHLHIIQIKNILKNSFEAMISEEHLTRIKYKQNMLELEMPRWVN